MSKYPEGCAFVGELEPISEKIFVISYYHKIEPTHWFKPTSCYEMPSKLPATRFKWCDKFFIYDNKIYAVISYHTNEDGMLVINRFVQAGYYIDKHPENIPTKILIPAWVYYDHGTYYYSTGTDRNEKSWYKITEYEILKENEKLLIIDDKYEGLVSLSYMNDRETRYKVYKKVNQKSWDGLWGE